MGARMARFRGGRGDAPSQERYVEVVENMAVDIDVEPIERLAQKVKGLISVLERTRDELSQTTEDNVRLSREVEELRAQLASAERSEADATSLRKERDEIRARVSEMLDQLESISV